MTPPPSTSCVVSVVMPVYNGAGTVQLAIQSALDQKIESCEILVVDDGSTDGSAAKLQAYKDDPRVKILTHPDGANRGAGASRRLALEHARGEFVGFLDADDLYLPGNFSKHVEILRQNPQVVLVHGPVERQTDDPSVAEWTFNLGDKPEIYDLTKKSYYLRRNFIVGNSVLFRRSALRVKEDAPPVMIGGGEDWILWNCLGLRGLFYYDPEPLAVYSYHPASFTHRLHRKPGAAELTAIEFYLCILPRLPKWSMRLRALVALAYNLMALAELRRGPALKRGFCARWLDWIFGLVRKKPV